MACIDNARVATCVVVAALAGSAAAVFPSPARADDAADAATSLTEAATALVAVDQGTAAPVEVPAELEDQITEVFDAVSVEEEPSAPEPAPEAEPTVDQAAPQAAPEEAASAPDVSQNADTTPNPSDTTSDTAAPEPPAAVAPAGVAIQAAPTNLNVSVRVGSPGDNGPVTQVNVAAAVAVDAAPALAPTPSGSTSDASQTLPSSSAGTGSAAPASQAVSLSGSAPISRAADPEDAWTWEWDCLSVPSFAAISPGGSGAGSMPSNWTWIWNCGGNSSQYQGASSTQYHPINVNIAIRIASPGNDGPVTQANVAVGVALGGGTRDPGANPPSSSSAPPPGAGQSPAPTAVSPAAVLSPFASVPAGTEGDGFSAPVLAEPVLTSMEDPAELALVPSAGGAGAAQVGHGASSILRPARLGTFPRGAWLGSGIRPALGPAGIDVPELRPAGTVAQMSNPGTSEATQRAKPVTRWRTRAPSSPLPETAPLGASAAPSAGGGSSSGGLPIFLALPFLVAVLDLARRVAIERIATPSGHRSRIPDTPG